MYNIIIQISNFLHPTLISFFIKTVISCYIRKKMQQNKFFFGIDRSLNPDLAYIIHRPLQTELSSAK